VKIYEAAAEEALREKNERQGETQKTKPVLGNEGFNTKNC
jgi:hypothetical protein